MTLIKPFLKRNISSKGMLFVDVMTEFKRRRMSLTYVQEVRITYVKFH